jgi:hypothetical protein
MRKLKTLMEVDPAEKRKVSDAASWGEHWSAARSTECGEVWQSQVCHCRRPGEGAAADGCVAGVQVVRPPTWPREICAPRSGAD